METLSRTSELGYDRSRARVGIVHIGIGAFHRGHQETYADDLLRLGERDCGVRAVNLFPPELRAFHHDQGGVYGVLTRNQHRIEARLVGSLLAVDDAETATPDVLSDPDVRLATMTITEKGYCHIPGTRELDLGSLIRRDLADPHRPVTAIGFLAEALDRRRRAGAGPIVIASCDNIPANGHLLAATLGAYVRRVSPVLADWIDANVSFPVSMVDRIVPRMDDEARAALEAALGRSDRLGVVTEPFRQWVLERRFAAAIPPLETVGVQIVDDVEPFEVMKHRILNGAQTAIAHVGHLAGFATSYEASVDPTLTAYLTALMRFQAETVDCPPGENLESYAALSLERLQNPYIRHPLVQIGTDSSFKIGQRIAQPIVHHLGNPRALDLYAFTLAAWIRYNTGADRNGHPIPIDDPLKPRFLDITRAAGGDAAALVDGFLALDMFDPRVREADDFRKRTAGLVAALGHASPVEIIADLVTS